MNSDHNLTLLHKTNFSILHLYLWLDNPNILFSLTHKTNILYRLSYHSRLHISYVSCSIFSSCFPRTIFISEYKWRLSSLHYHHRNLFRSSSHASQSIILKVKSENIGRTVHVVHIIGNGKDEERKILLFRKAEEKNKLQRWRIDWGRYLIWILNTSSVIMISK
jgi:hypothetical protein